MKKAVLCLLFCLLSLTILSCSKEEGENVKVVARINDYVLTLDEFQRQLAEEMRMDRDFKLTKKAKNQFLEALITKELMIQEAKRRKLDREEKFIRAMERYWESTLIKDLMEVKGMEIEERTTVSEKEIETRYEKMKGVNDVIPPLEKIRDKVHNEVLEEKKNRMLSGWIEDIRRRAKISINQEVLLSN